MRTEVPVCRRCCFCVPLRYGLLGWAYFKLIANLIVLIMLIYSFFKSVSHYFTLGYARNGAIVSGIFSLVIACEISFIVVLIVGGHKKNVKLLRINYLFTLVVWILTIIATLVLICLALSNLRASYIQLQLWLIMLDGAGMVASILVDGYFLIIVRSEIIKLTNNCEFRFENNAANAQCVLNIAPETLNNEEPKNVHINHKKDMEEALE